MAQSSFEKDLEQLESVVAALEEGGLSLDDALKRFEEGIKLSRRCDKALTEAEKRVEILVKNADGALEAKPFADAEAKGGEGKGGEGKHAEEAAPAPAKAPARAADAGPGSETAPEQGEDGELLF